MARFLHHALDSNYVEFYVLVTFKLHFSPKMFELALSIFMKFVDLFLGFKMDTSFASFGFEMRELWLDLCRMFELKFQQQ